MKDLLLELSLEIMEKYNIDKITIEATKFVAKELTKRLKYKKFWSMEKEVLFLVFVTVD